MYVPYLTPVAPYYPLQPIGIPHGLSHTGIPQMPMPGSSFGWINPLQYGTAVPGIYGPGFAPPYRQIGYGYGLSHAPYLPEASYGPLQAQLPYGALSPLAPMTPIPHIHGISPLQAGMPLQPNWSQIHPIQQQPTI